MVEGLLPRAAVPAWHRLGRFGFPILIVLLVIVPMVAPQWNVVAQGVAPIVRGVVETLLGLGGLGFGGLRP